MFFNRLLAYISWCQTLKYERELANMWLKNSVQTELENTRYVYYVNCWHFTIGVSVLCSHEIHCDGMWHTASEWSNTIMMIVNICHKIMIFNIVNHATLWLLSCIKWLHNTAKQSWWGHKNKYVSHQHLFQNFCYLFYLLLMWFIM